MRILYISGGISFGASIYKYGLSFSHGILKALAPGNKITLVCLVDYNDAEIPERGVINDICDEVILVKRRRYTRFGRRMLRVNCFFINRLMEVKRADYPEMRARIKGLDRPDRFDVAIYDSYTVVQYADCIRNIPKVLYLGDSLTLNAEEFIKSATLGIFDRLELSRIISAIKNFEKNNYNGFTKIIVAADGDRKQILELNPKLDIAVLPFGVDTEHFRRGPSREDDNTIVFTGVLWAEHNADAVSYFYNDIWPVIRKKNHKASLKLVGGSSRKGIERIMAADTNVKLVDFVEDIRPYLDSSAVFISPMRIGSGMNNKILEAMSMSKAIVTTEYGNRQVGLKDGSEAMVCRDRYQFADAVLRLLADKDKRIFFGENARRKAEREFSSTIYSQKLQEIITGAVSERKDR